MKLFRRFRSLSVRLEGHFGEPRVEIGKTKLWTAANDTSAARRLGYHPHDFTEA